MTALPPGGPGPDRGAPGMDGDSVGTQCVAGQFADPRLLPVDQRLGALDDGDLRAHPSVELAEFDADGADADQQDPRGDVPDVGGLPVGPHRHLIQAVDVRADRLRSGGDDNVFCLQEVAACFDLAGGDPRGALDHRGPGLLVAADPGGVVEMVVIVAQLRPVQRRVAAPAALAASALASGARSNVLDGMHAQ